MPTMTRPFLRPLHSARPSTAPERRNWLLAALSPDVFNAMAPHLSEIPLEPGRVLQDAHAPIERVYFPHAGAVAFVTMDGDGHALETAAVGRESAVNLNAALGSRHALRRAVVQLPGVAAQISAARLAEIAERSIELRHLATRSGDALLAQTQQTAMCLARHDVESRLVRWLLHARDCMGSDTLPMTQESLAEALGVRRTTVTLVMQLLQTQALVRCRRGSIHVEDVAGLEHKACSCYEIVRDLPNATTRTSELQPRSAASQSAVGLHPPARTVT